MMARMMCSMMKNGHATVAQAPDDLHHFVHFGRSEAGHDLVEQQEFGFRGQRPRNFEALAVGDGQIPGFHVLLVDRDSGL